MNISGVYKIQSIIKPNRFYIGSALNFKKRWGIHLNSLRKGTHHSVKLQRHFNKYGKDDLIFIILEPCFPEFLIIREQFYIDTLKPYFNVCKVAGSQLGVKRSIKSCNKIRLSLIGRIPWNKGKKCPPLSLETRKKQSESHRGEKNAFYGNHSLTGENNPNYGKHPSDETRIKQIESAKNRQPISEETRLKHSESMKGNTYRKGKLSSEETRNKQSESSKKYWDNKRSLRHAS